MSYYWIWRKTYRREVVFLIKIFNFYQKKQLLTKKDLSARLLSVAKNSALFALYSNTILAIYTQSYIELLFFNNFKI